MYCLVTRLLGRFHSSILMKRKSVKYGLAAPAAQLGAGANVVQANFSQSGRQKVTACDEGPV